MNVERDDSSSATATAHRWGGRDCQLWLARIDRLYRRLRTAQPPTIEGARKVLLSANSRISECEKVLVTLIDHPDRRAEALLRRAAASLEHRRLQFVCYIAQKRRRRRCRADRRRRPRAA